MNSELVKRLRQTEPRHMNNSDVRAIFNEAADAIETLQRKVPDGMVEVTKEDAKELDALRASLGAFADRLENGEPYARNQTISRWIAYIVRDMRAAMLASAPEPPTAASEKVK